MRVLIDSKKMSYDTVRASLQSFDGQVSRLSIYRSPVIGVVRASDIEQSPEFSLEEIASGTEIDWLHDRTRIVEILVEGGRFVWLHLSPEKETMNCIERTMSVG